MTHESEREQVAREIHDTYEQAAIAAGWETQKASRVPWDDVPESNKECTRAIADYVLTRERAAFEAGARKQLEAASLFLCHPRRSEAETLIQLSEAVMFMPLVTPAPREREEGR